MSSPRGSHQTLCAAVAAAAALLAIGHIHAQGRQGQPPLPRTAAPIDLTGYWVSVITQDWRWRMVTPAQGDYFNMPMNLAAKKIADAWDPAKDEAAGEQCRSYGAPALMSAPGRLHISWQDDNTLKVDADAGTQTRVFHFGDWKPNPKAQASWQGDSIAQWQRSRANVPVLLRPAFPAAGPGTTQRSGSLKVTTTHLRPGYLRKNGVPYSANTLLTEYWDVFKRPNGDQWLMITTRIEDPVYLNEPRLISPQFKKEPDGAKWDPTPCSARW